MSAIDIWDFGGRKGILSQASKSKIKKKKFLLTFNFLCFHVYMNKNEFSALKVYLQAKLLDMECWVKRV